MYINQISIFIENKYGRLCEILALLANEEIRIIAATIADTSEYGILRLIVSEPQRAYRILQANSVPANLAHVLAIDTQSSVDSFVQMLEYFTQSGLSIEYMYCFSLKGRSILFLRTNSLAAALEVVRQQNLECVSEADLINL
ncbi:MAG: acetolactate synthase [Tannerella sp.]|jgi:hypothetical protein|nr:acetolactate synthase [Tannerella sp.]